MKERIIPLHPRSYRPRNSTYHGLKDERINSRKKKKQIEKKMFGQAKQVNFVMGCFGCNLLCRFRSGRLAGDA